MEIVQMVLPPATIYSTPQGFAQPVRIVTAQLGTVKNRSSSVSR